MWNWLKARVNVWVILGALLVAGVLITNQCQLVLNTGMFDFFVHRVSLLIVIVRLSRRVASVISVDRTRLRTRCRLGR